MSKVESNKRAIWFVVIVFILASARIGLAAVPQSTIRTTGGITTFVGHYGNFTESVNAGDYFYNTVNVTEYLLNANTTGAATFATIDTGQGDNELYDMDQNVLEASAVLFSTVDTGQGANDLYDMDQNVLEASAVTFATVDTGYGDNELWDMDQHVQTSDDVVFNSANLTTRSEFGTQFNVSAEINSNWEWSGDVVLLQAHWNTSLSQGKLVYINTNGTIQNTDADSSASVPCIGITLEAITANTYGLVLTRGWIYNSAWTLDEGRDVYVSTTAGDVTVTLPNGSGDQIQVVGIGISEDLMLFNPDYTILEIV